MSDAPDLAQWLVERIAEDEDAARDDLGEPIPGDCWGPRRALAELDAKRRIIAEHALDGWDCRVCANEESSSDDSEGNRDWYRSSKDYPCQTLRLLAAPYSDRPGYLPSWRPEGSEQ